MFGLKRKIGKFPVTVIIAEKRENAIQWSFDHAKRLRRDDGTQAYYLKRRGEEIPPPDYTSLHVGSNGKTILPLYSPQQGQYVPMNIKNPPNLSVEDKELTFWDVMETRRSFEIYPRKGSWFEKYAPFIILAFTGALMVLIVMFTFRNMASISGNIATVSANLKETAQILVEKMAGPPFG